MLTSFFHIYVTIAKYLQFDFPHNFQYNGSKSKSEYVIYIKKRRKLFHSMMNKSFLSCILNFVLKWLKKFLAVPC